MNANPKHYLKSQKFQMNTKMEKKEPFEHEAYRESKFDFVRKNIKYTKTPFCNFAAG